MNQINWTQVAVFGVVVLLVFLVGGGCLLLGATAGGGMMGGYGYSGGPSLCPWCGRPTGGPGSGGMMPGLGGYGVSPSGFLGSILSLLIMSAVIGVPILLVLLLVGLLAWLMRGARRSSGPGSEEV
ncbi:MAG: hypothetical protein KKA73_22465 [Chloroflexi bacterium]|nr:hypothetical protein [Chloroflexota bacterium]MBU1750458.1 hypothetical protein [Chloroflexota bacterium]MBU1877781.1 hypothetical protein [Chloroflexota bacterium]